MLAQQSIIDFCNSYDYDIRKNHNGRWIDQKCAADVVTVVADCVYNYVLQNGQCSFTTKQIWHSEYTVNNVESIFKKPGVEDKTAHSEYDKFFQQPMEMLANARVLAKIKVGKNNQYHVERMDILEYIALRERNALFFLKTYIEKVLQDSGVYSYFEDFFTRQDKDSFSSLKKRYSAFIIENTPINGKTECDRIFIKVINPLAYYKNSRGTEKGHLSNQNVTYDMLMYNRNNFRDIYAEKPKGVTRKEYLKEHPVQVNEAYCHYQSTKAKKFLRQFNDLYRKGLTEHKEEKCTNDNATHMHHIFPESDYPEICYYYENIIALTPTQHLNKAHPMGNTKEIDEQYQHLLLLSKADRIQENLISETEEKVYEFSNFIFVLNVGFGKDEDRLVIDDMDFISVINAINLHYSI